MNIFLFTGALNIEILDIDIGEEYSVNMLMKESVTCQVTSQTTTEKLYEPKSHLSN